MKPKLINQERAISVLSTLGNRLNKDGQIVMEQARNAVRLLPPESYLFGVWAEVKGCMTPEGTPLFVCQYCGGSEHLHGVEYPRRKMICDECGSINKYPWEKTYEEDKELENEESR